MEVFMRCYVHGGHSHMVDINQQTILASKLEARDWLTKHKSIYITSFIRFLFVLCNRITWVSFLYALSFDDTWHDYKVHVTNMREFGIIIVVTTFGIIFSEYLLDKALYQNVSLQHHIMRWLRLTGYTMAGIIGLFATFIAKAPLMLGQLWLLVTIGFYIRIRLMNLGCSHVQQTTQNTMQTFKERKLKTLSDWKPILAFHRAFLGHDSLNCITAGLYGIWSIPYKRTTEMVVFKNK